MADLFSSILGLIQTVSGSVQGGGEIPLFDPLYNLTVVLWMAAIAAILVAPFWKKFRAFAVFLTWLAIFLTLVEKGSSPQSDALTALSSLFHIALSFVFLIVFVILTLWIFGRLIGGKKMVPTPRVS